MILWAIGGVDPTGGAGLVRDAWTVERVAPGAALHCVATALTDQGHRRAARAFAVDPARVRACIERLPGPDAIKLGLVPAALAEDLERVLAGHAVPIVLDPVMVASDGGSLGSDAGALRRLAARASVVTPNPDEAHALAGSGSQAPDMPRLRADLGGPALLFKSIPGQPPGQVCDLLLDAEGTRAFTRARVDGPDPRGTGCALATAIACRLGAGVRLREAVAEAIAWLDRARLYTRPGLDGRAHLS